jgi:hypothetical protein
MQATRNDLPVALDAPEGQIHVGEWGGMSVEMGIMNKAVDPAPFFHGLPDDRCQCPHWGYVIKGQLTYKTAQGDQVIKAGQAYYVGPGHTPVFEAGTEYVEFSPPELLAKTSEVVVRNLEAGVNLA